MPWPLLTTFPAMISSNAVVANFWSTGAATNLAPVVASSVARFEAMRTDCCLSVPAAKNARYIGSRFTIRVVEDDPASDRRILHVRDGAPGEIHIFSGKVVSAVKAARIVCQKVAGQRND